MPRATTTPVQISIPTALVVAVVGLGLVTRAVVLGTALYGSEEKSERAFRLLDRIPGRTSEPQKPEPSPTARSRTRPTSRGESVRAATLRP
ncbi:hypothetical protein [Streptomyces caniscabiei]|uniref:hypothetical protein n=1 Tax=Streptomyces caniscabiei TaxID=2746961 RepID=UPI0029BB39D8|nr:hypothetical protein [Streptomyces caniscabiei]MDX2948014.1 hypothetical protein [Streptomyces caniscabiei]